MTRGDYTVVALTMTTKRKRALKKKIHYISRGAG
jgi:hypothetical protein